MRRVPRGGTVRAERMNGMLRRCATGFFSITLLALVLLVCWIGQGDPADKFHLKAGAKGELCFKCHVDFKAKLKKRFTHTPVARGECTGCHDPHTSNHGKLLDADPGRVCSACHDAVVPAEAKSAHKVVAEGKCTSCHDPHAADQKNNLVKGGNELCFGCHEQVRKSVADIKRPHDPVKKDCLRCHNPHASAKGGSLLKAEVPGLCRQCHDTGAKMFATLHANYPVANARCTSCHNAHGSNREAILYDDVHQPVAKRMCAQCHQPPDAPDALKTRKEGYELCRVCHSEMVNVALSKGHVHGPLLSGDGCLSCHRPHAASGKALLPGQPGRVCGKCHGDTAKRYERSQVKHEPIRDGDCSACHDPHSSDSRFLAKKASTIDMCAGCHDWQRHSTHPIGDNVVDPRNSNGTVQCLSCHRSHGTEYEHMIPFSTVSNLCIQCHEKYKR